MSELLGYARVSTTDQNPDLQTDELEAAGCYKVYVDHASGAHVERPQLARVLEDLRPKDTLVVWRLDRLARSLRDLIEIVKKLEAREVAFRSLRENIDTTSPGGRLLFHLMGALAEFERELIRERTLAGLAAAKSRGRTGGRPVVMTEPKIARAQELYAGRNVTGLTVADIARTLEVSRASVYRHVGPGSPADLDGPE